MPDLTNAQEARLNEFERNDPEAKVTGWDPKGPIVRFSDGRKRVINAGGRITQLSSAKRRSRQAGGSVPAKDPGVKRTRTFAESLRAERG